ncbi:hypothetical protein GW881_04660, partial [Candidatus Roizmanbacteria bacterium]|nr:hypothetical protein [Candidatus Roizmanbacteria bacterium]
MNYIRKNQSLFLILLFIFILGFSPVKDTDFGWHYRCGKQIISGNTPCLKNTFSYYLSNY